MKDRSFSRNIVNSNEISVLSQILRKFSEKFDLYLFSNECEGPIQFSDVNSLLAYLNKVDYDGGISNLFL